MAITADNCASHVGSDTHSCQCREENPRNPRSRVCLKVCAEVLKLPFGVVIDNQENSVSWWHVET